MGESERPSEARNSQVDASQANDVSLSASQDCSGSTGEMGEGQSKESVTHEGEHMGISDTLGSLSASITSPAKFAFIGYVVLAYAGKVATSTLQFLLVASVFFVLQVIHDDYLRILLNRSAELKAAAKRSH
jgi:hypothetical protein